MKRSARRSDGRRVFFEIEAEEVDSGEEEEDEVDAEDDGKW